MATITLGNLTILLDRFDVRIAGQPVTLTYLEFELLLALARNAGKVMTRARLLHDVWREPATGDDRKLTVHMSRLRRKLQASEPWQIETYARRGYALVNRADFTRSSDDLQNGLRSANSARVLARVTEAAPMKT